MLTEHNSRGHDLCFKIGGINGYKGYNLGKTFVINPYYVPTFYILSRGELHGLLCLDKLLRKFLYIEDVLMITRRSENLEIKPTHPIHIFIKWV